MEFDDDLPSNTHDTEKENLNTDNSSPKVAVSNFFVSIYSLKNIFNVQNKIIVFNVLVCFRRKSQRSWFSIVTTKPILKERIQA